MDINLNIKELYKELYNIKEKIKEIDSLKKECCFLKRKIDENTKEITELKLDNKYLRRKLEEKNIDNNIIIDTKKEVLIEYQDENIKNRFENKLSNIFSDIGQEIPDKDIKCLKKLGSAILIKYKQSPLEFSKSIMDRIFNSNKDIDEISIINKELKKGLILIAMDDITYGKLVQNNPSKFLEDFKEKYGIEDKEISDEELKNNMIKYNYNENRIIEAILKILKFIT